MADRSPPRDGCRCTVERARECPSHFQVRLARWFKLEPQLVSTCGQGLGRRDAVDATANITVERTRSRLVLRGHQVPLPHHVGAVTVLHKDLGQEPVLERYVSVVAGIASCELV